MPNLIDDGMNKEETSTNDGMPKKSEIVIAEASLNNIPSNAKGGDRSTSF